MAARAFAHIVACAALNRLARGEKAVDAAWFEGQAARHGWVALRVALRRSPASDGSICRRATTTVKVAIQTMRAIGTIRRAKRVTGEGRAIGSS